MSQPRPHGLSSPAAYSSHALNPQLNPLTSPLTSNPTEKDSDDPFTGPLLKRWADQQLNRFEKTESKLDLWSGIQKKLDL